MITELDHIRDTTNVDIKHIYDIINEFRKGFKGVIDVTTIVEVATRLMQQIGILKGVSGQDKKFIVTKLLIYLVKQTGEGPIDDLMDSILINIIPIVIDKLICVENKKLVFNKAVSGSCCFKFK